MIKVKLLYIFFKLFLGLIGSVSLISLFVILYLIGKFLFFTEPIIGKEILNYEGICGVNITTSLANKKCQNLMTIYWLLVIGFGSLIIALITIYPFLKIKIKKWWRFKIKL